MAEGNGVSEGHNTDVSQYVERIPLGKLTPWKRNARTHSKKQIRQIADSIRTFGFTNPVLIDRDLRILAGHGRAEAAKLLGWADVPCLRLEHMTENQKRAYVLTFLSPSVYARSSLKIQTASIESRFRTNWTTAREWLA